MNISPISKPGILILLAGIIARVFGEQLAKIPLVGKWISGKLVPVAKIIILVGALLCLLALFRYLYAKNPKLFKTLGIAAIIAIVAFFCIKNGKLIYLILFVIAALILFLVSKFLKKGEHSDRFRSRPNARKAEPVITIEDVQPDARPDARPDAHNYTKKMNEF